MLYIILFFLFWFIVGAIQDAQVEGKNSYYHNPPNNTNRDNNGLNYCAYCDYSYSKFITYCPICGAPSNPSNYYKGDGTFMSPPLKFDTNRLDLKLRGPNSVTEYAIILFFEHKGKDNYVALRPYDISIDDLEDDDVLFFRFQVESDESFRFYEIQASKKTDVESSFEKAVDVLIQEKENDVNDNSTEMEIALSDYHDANNSINVSNIEDITDEVADCNDFNDTDFWSDFVDESFYEIAENINRLDPQDSNSYEYESFENEENYDYVVTFFDEEGESKDIKCKLLRDFYLEGKNYLILERNDNSKLLFYTYTMDEDETLHLEDVDDDNLLYSQLQISLQEDPYPYDMYDDNYFSYLDNIIMGNGDIISDESEDYSDASITEPIAKKKEECDILLSRIDEEVLHHHHEHFEGFIHYTKFDNLEGIIRSGKLYSRNYMQQNHVNYSNSADNDVIDITSEHIKDGTRFYYYYNTPTSYKFQKSNPDCPYIVLVFDKSLIYSKDVSFFEKNAARYDGYESETKDAEYAALNFNWQEIFERGSYSVSKTSDIISGHDKTGYRNAEMICYDPVELTYLKVIYFKDWDIYKQAKQYYKDYPISNIFEYDFSGTRFS